MFCADQAEPWWESLGLHSRAVGSYTDFYTPPPGSRVLPLITVLVGRRIPVACACRILLWSLLPHSSERHCGRDASFQVDPFQPVSQNNQWPALRFFCVYHGANSVQPSPWVGRPHAFLCCPETGQLRASILRNSSPQVWVFSSSFYSSQISGCRSLWGRPRRVGNMHEVLK